MNHLPLIVHTGVSSPLCDQLPLAVLERTAVLILHVRRFLPTFCTPTAITFPWDEVLRPQWLALSRARARVAYEAHVPDLHQLAQVEQGIADDGDVLDDRLAGWD